MANPEKQAKGAKVPSRAASLQRMLEMERKQKMERMQLQNPSQAPAPGRRGVSPASQTSSSNSSKASAGGVLLNRRRDAASPQSLLQPRSLLPVDDPRMSTARTFTLPPLSIHMQPIPRVTLTPDLTTANLSEPKMPPQQEPRSPDRNGLPSMVRAATSGLEPSSLKKVVFAAEDGTETDGSSICHSPTWDDYGKKRRKKKEKELEMKRKRLTKEPPPAAMDNHPVTIPRTRSDTTLSIHQLRRSLENGGSSQQIPDASANESHPMPAVEPALSIPAFIGGVRLEREREAVLQRMSNGRDSLTERSASQALVRSPESHYDEDPEVEQGAAPAVSYPPTASKSRPGPRARRASFGSSFILAAGKLFNPKDKERAESRASVLTVSTHDGSESGRGRHMSGSTVTHSRGSSYDAHDRYEERHRSVNGQPPEAWKNFQQKKNRKSSFSVLPPTPGRDGAFSPTHPQYQQNDFDALNFPFCAPTGMPVASPVGGLRPKNTPPLTPISPNTPAATSKKSFKDAFRTGFRSGSATPEAKVGRRRSATIETLVGTDITQPTAESVPDSQTTAVNDAASSSKHGVRRGAEQHGCGQTHSGDSKDSRASSASSHPDSESLPPSPMTTPEGSRPQSKKDNQAFRLEDLMRAPPLSYENVINMRGSPTLPPRSLYIPPKKTESPRTNVEKPSGPPKDLVGRQQGRSGSNFLEELPPSRSFMTDEFWSTSARTIDSDQLSFTSALTRLDVKRSFADLDQAVDSPNCDVTPLSLEDVSRPQAVKSGQEAITTPMGFQFDLPNGVSTTNSSPVLPHHATASRVRERLPSNETSQRSHHAWANSPSFPGQPVRKASDYLEEARKAALASPRTPAGNISPSSFPTPGKNNPNTHARSSSRIALLGPKPTQQQSESSTAASRSNTTTPTTSSSHLQQKQVQPRAPADASSSSSSATAASGTSKLGKPISKMLVECCHCKFYHDMPSAVYRAMTQPDDIVKDKVLGVSGLVTTCVKCPWCAHNMSTVCCAGYAAVVYLRERLHGP